MKKILLLVSGLSLVACGGGSGGSSVPSDAVRIGTVTQDAADSNAVITSMVSEIGILPDDVDAPSINIGRMSNGSFIHNGKQYRSYQLDDVKLLMGDWGAARFHVDANGKVDKIVFENNSNIESDVERQGNSDKFIVHFKSGELQDDERDVRFSYNSYAKELGLSYVDFGIFNGQSPFSGENVVLPFIAGYDIKQIENPTARMEFTGLAKGSVARNVDGHDSAQTTITDTNAKLLFDNGTEILTADFDNWYKMTVTRNTDDSFNVAFDGTNKTISAEHSLDVMIANNITDDDSVHEIDMQTRYYGNVADTKEATALVNYQQQIDSDQNVNVTFGFAGKEH